MCSSDLGETFWQVDVKSDERGTDTHAVVRLDESPQRAAPQPAGLPGPAPSDGTETPLLAPGYSAAASGRDSKPRAGAVVGIIVGLAIFGYGIYQVVEAFKGEERTTYTVPIYQPQPPAGLPSDPGSSTSLFDCLDRAGTDTIARSRCISEYNNSVAPPGER